jgi:hypothetical protein
MKFKCPEEGCEYVLDTHTYSSKNKPKCPIHDVELVYIKEHEGFPTSIGEFKNLSSGDKKRLLKKRAHNHFNKEVKDVKEQMIKDFDNSNK